MRGSQVVKDNSADRIFYARPKEGGSPVGNSQAADRLEMILSPPQRYHTASSDVSATIVPRLGFTGYLFHAGVVTFPSAPRYAWFARQDRVFGRLARCGGNISKKCCFHVESFVRASFLP
jgi:hypothetical protein